MRTKLFFPLSYIFTSMLTSISYLRFNNLLGNVTDFDEANDYVSSSNTSTGNLTGNSSIKKWVRLNGIPLGNTTTHNNEEANSKSGYAMEDNPKNGIITVFGTPNGRESNFYLRTIKKK